MPPTPQFINGSDTAYSATHALPSRAGCSHYATHPHSHSHSQLRVHLHPPRSDFNSSKQLLKACEANNFVWVSSLLQAEQCSATHSATAALDPATTPNTLHAEYITPKKGGVNVDICDEDGWSGLHWSSRHNNCKVLAALLKAGCDINKTTRTGDSALSLAVLYGNTDAAMMLLQRRDCNVNTSTKDGKTPLMLACRFNHSVLAEALLEAGASTSSRTTQGDDCLSLSTKNGHQDIVKLLVNAGAVQFENSPEFEHAVEVCKDEEIKRLLISETRWYLRKPFLMVMKEGGVVGPSDSQTREKAATSHRKLLPSTLQDAVFGNLYREIAMYL